ncbi:MULTISPECIES: LacI family DNA-binding transcriptional regulator [Cellulomonas]|jgi:LacI family transcriptional regulator|uniref:LacI family DNA-binding transcriptional regulator n=1 Tax=Cellulomonas TaxID=1707 RepID=UPI000626EBBF|nr:MULTISPECIES: LacI family DNA-binding transcriptional regulator [Cellulomonas]MBO9567982.1 LacI family DNA-binding transcriptional regulator [Cellulomonas iranensis]UCN13585.1 LacI family transcriptional regulator [Cellulomonas iranensis]
MTTTDGRPRPVTLRDVAQLAGVSVATASKALNGKAEVHPDTRRRVQEIADRLSFTPNSLARAITAGQTGTVGLLTHDLEGRFSLPILMGAEDAFGAGSTSVFLCDARGDAIREQHHLRALLGRRVDGLIVVGSTTDPRPSLGTDVPVPAVYAYAPSVDPRDASVVPDNVTAGRLAAEHLLALGRRRIAHVSGDATYAAAQDRATGVAQALAAAGVEQVGPVRYGSWTEAWGRAGVAAALEADPRIDAVVCGSDQIARGVLDALRERGVGVPGDVAVIGFDNWQPMIAGSRPALTSVDMNFETMGRRAATRLSALVAGQQDAGVETIEPRVVVRASTAGD